MPPFVRESLKKIAAWGIGLLLSIAFLALIEGAFRLNRAYSWVDVRGFFSGIGEGRPKAVENWDGINKKFLAGIPDHFQEIRKKYGDRSLGEQTKAHYISSSRDEGSYRYFKRAPDGETIFDILYRYNNKQRRPTPDQPRLPTSSIFLVGDSFVLGEGVQENETMAAYMQMGLERVAVESLAFHGWGINNHLSSLRGEGDNRHRPNPYRELEKRPVIVVYIFIHDHIYRANCPLSCYQKDNEWMLSLPDYTINEQGKAEYAGPFLESRRFSSIFRWIANSAIVTQLGLDWPDSGSSGELKKYFGILNTYRKELGKKAPIRDFYFVLADPHVPFGAKISSMARDNGYKVLDLSNLAIEKMVGKSPGIPFDGHFTAPANYILARRILTQVQQDHPEIR